MLSYDIFISYRWAGDVAYEFDGRGWVAGFKDALASRLQDRLNRDVRVFLDLEELPRNEPLHEALRSAIESTALFLSIVTESSSQEGSWARWEIAHFANCAYPVCGPPTDRIFKAKLYPVPRAGEPELLRRRAEYQFYGRYGRDADQAPFPCPLDQLQVPKTPPGIEFGRLVDDLAARLGECGAPAPVPPDGTRLIYVASTNLAAKRERLCGDLRGKGHRLITETPWPECSADEFGERVGMRLVEAETSIHLLCVERQTNDGWGESVSEIELRKAMDVAERPDKSSFRIFTWRENESGPSSSTATGPQSPLYERLSRVRGVTNFNGKGWEYMLSNVFLGLKDLVAPVREPVEPVQPSEEYTCEVFVHCLEDDRDLAQQIRDKLLGHRVWVWLLPQPFEFWQRLNTRKVPLRRDAHILALFQRFYRKCDGMLVLYGHPDEIWAFDRCDELNDFFGANPPRRNPAICLAPPEDEKKRNFQYRGFWRYRLDEIEKYVLHLPCAASRVE